MTRRENEGSVLDLTVNECPVITGSAEIFTCDYIKEYHRSLNLPNSNWHVMLGTRKFIGFFKAETNASVKVKVVIEDTLNVKILLNEQIIDWLHFVRPRSLSDVESILETVDRMDL